MRWQQDLNRGSTELPTATGLEPHLGGDGIYHSRRSTVSFFDISSIEHFLGSLRHTV